VSKVWRVDLIGLATRCMLGQHPSPWMPDPFDLGYVGVKCSQFSFARLHQADPVSGVDMASTGEVGCLGRSSDEALLKAMLSVGHRIPAGAVLLSTGDAFQKAELLPACRMLAAKGHTLYATDGSCRYLVEHGVPALRVRWPDEPDDGTPSAQDLIREHQVDLVVNNPKNFSHSELGNGYHLRRAAVDFNVPLITDARLASAFIRAFCTLPDEALEIRSWGAYAGKW
jgi:MGS-like domain.